MVQTQKKQPKLKKAPDSSDEELLRHAQEIMDMAPGDLQEDMEEVMEDTSEALDDLENLAEQSPEQIEKRNKEIARGLERLTMEVESDTDREQLNREIEQGLKKGKFDAVGAHMKETETIKSSESKKAEIDRLLEMQDPFAKAANDITALRSVSDSIPKWMKDGDDMFEHGGDAVAKAEEMIDKFYIVDEKTGLWRKKTAWEMAKDNYEDKGLWSGVKGFFMGMFLGDKLKKFESSINLGMKVKGKAEGLVDEYGDDVRELKDKAGNIVDTVKEGHERFKDVSEDLRQNPEAVAALKVLKRKQSEALNDVAKAIVQKKDPAMATKKLAENMSGIMKEVGKSSPTMQKAVAESVKRGELKGFGVKKVGKFMVISVLTEAIFDAVTQKEPTQFMDTLSNANLWQEAIPGVGSYKSVGRLFQDNGDPMWVKGLDAGINVVGDVWLVGSTLAGCVFGVGFGCVPGAAAGVAGRTAMVTGAKGLLKMGGQQAMKKGAAVAGKEVLKSVAKKTITRKIIKEGGKKLVQETIKETGKKAIVKTVPYTGQHIVKKEVLEGVVRASIKSSAKFSAGMIAVEEGLKKFFPTEKVKEMAVKVGENEVRKRLTPGQSKLYTVMTGGDLIEDLKERVV